MAGESHEHEVIKNLAPCPKRKYVIPTCETPKMRTREYVAPQDQNRKNFLRAKKGEYAESLKSK